MLRQDEITPESLRSRIRRHRLTREEAAERLGVSRRTLQRWLAGYPIRPYHVRLILVALAYR